MQREGAFSSDFFPEMLGKIIVLNAPYLYAAVWKMMKHFVPSRTRKKVKILTKYVSLPPATNLTSSLLIEDVGTLATC